MYLVVHSLFGGALAYLFGWWGVVLALISHYLLDAVPHTHYSKRIRHILFVIALTIIVDLFVFKINNSYMFLIGAFISSIPDVDDALVLISKNKFLLMYYDWHSRIQHETANIIGTVTQVAVILLSFILLFL